MTTALLLKIGAESAQLKSDLNKANSQVNQFISKMTAAGGAIAGALTVGTISQFVFEVSKLSAEADGVRYAFHKIGGSVKLLHDLKEATHGTVSELELMKNAVAFKNFNLDVSQLPKLLEFATLRAQQTGQSVDYLVQSIVTGLGRKSVLILDNLGISAAALNEEVAKTGDFFNAVGTIVDREITNMGSHIENTMTKTERLSAAWTNLKVAIGDAANGTGVLGQAMDALSQSMLVMSSKYLTLTEKAMALASPAGMTMAIAKMAAKEQAALAEEQRRHNVTIEYATEAIKKYKGNLDEITKAYKDIGGGQEVIAEATRMLNEQESKKQTLIQNEKNLTEQLNAKKEAALLLTGAARAAINDEIKAIESKIKALQALTAAETVQKQSKVKQPQSIQRDNPLFSPINNIDTINASIATLKAIDLKPVEASFIDLSATVQSSMAAMAIGLGTAIGDMMSGVGGIELLAGNIVAAFGGMAVELGQAMIQFGFAGIALKKFSLQPELAVAAGIALVALGRILGNKAAAITGGGGGSYGGRSGGSSPLALQKIEYGQRLEVTGEFELRNDRLVAAIETYNRKKNRSSKG